MIWLENIVSKPKWLWSILFGSLLLSHLWMLHLPPQGEHIWRQCHTSAVARNFVEEGMNPFETRIDARGETNGITGSHFPAFEYSVALISKLTGGYWEGYNRWFALLCFALSMLFIHRILRSIWNDPTIAALGTWCYIWLPINYIYSATAVPDVLALCAGLAGISMGIRWLESRRVVYLLLSAVSLILAGMVKVQFILYGAPVLMLVALKWNQRTAKERWMFMLSAGLMLLGVVLWYQRAWTLREVSGLRDFGYPLEFPLSWLDYVLSHMKTVFIRFPNNLIGFALLPIALVGLYRVFRVWKSSNDWKWPLVLLSAGFLVYQLVLAEKIVAHNYYMLLYTPLIVVLLVLGIRQLRMHLPILVFVLLALAPINAFFSVQHQWLNPNRDLPADFFIPEKRAELEALFPSGELAIVGRSKSPSIFHYFTHTKGTTIDDEFVLDQEVLRVSASKGYSRLMLSEKSMTELDEKALEEFRRIEYEGEVLVFDLEAKDP
jgi:uncharacterized membrane protein YhdT